MELEFLKLELYVMAIIYGKKIHVEIEYLRLDFLCSLVLLLPPRVPLFFLFPWITLWVFLPPWVPLFFLFPWVPLFFFFLSYMGSSLHLLSFFNFFRSFCSSFFFKFFFFFYRTRVPRGKKNLHVSNQNSRLWGLISSLNSSLKGLRCYSPQFFLEKTLGPELA